MVMVSSSVEMPASVRAVARAFSAARTGRKSPSVAMSS
jgi:hypothetical protein